MARLDQLAHRPIGVDRRERQQCAPGPEVLNAGGYMKALMELVGMEKTAERVVTLHRTWILHHDLHWLAVLPRSARSPVWAAPRRAAGSAFVGADELRHPKHVVPQRRLQLRHAGAGREPELLGKGVQPEAVAVRAAPPGRAGAAIADRAEVVAYLQRRWRALGQPVGVRGMPQASQWMKRPPGASGSSRISANERLPGGGAVHDSGGERSAPSQV
jgi:hypothetical protein